MAQLRYVHEEYTHDLSSPNQIVPLLIDLFHPQSVIDVGCGIGTFLHCFKQHHVKEVFGIDGHWANKDLVRKYLNENEFLEHDLSSDLNLQRSFNMCLCLEVGEHLNAAEAAILIKNLVKLSKVIIFSAAIPNQGGQNHINEQWPVYWQQQFRAHNYNYIDLLRPRLWENSNIHWWYRQNMFAVVHESVALPSTNTEKILHYVHPDLLGIKQQEIDAIAKGSKPLGTYLKYIYNKFFH